MNLFFCALRPSGQPVHKSDLFAFLARMPRDVEYETVIEGSFAAVAATGARAIRGLTGKHRHLIGVGDVRLDNRAEVLRFCRGLNDGASDLELVLAAIDARGAAVVNELHGDFAFVAWDSRAQKVVAARDAFGVKSLFLRREGGMVLFSSRAAPLAREEYDVDYLRDFLYGMPRATEHSVWKDVQRIEAGTVFEQRGTAGRVERYWSASDFSPASTMKEVDAISEFRRLFTSSIETRLDGARTWAQLSGGLDSSAIVSTAEACVRQGAVAGTVTLVDTLGDGDERAFSSRVVDRFGLRNLQVEDSWPWEQSANLGTTDEPTALYPFQARDDRMRSAVVSNGGRVLLSGLGSDHYLMGSLSYIPDLVMTGRLLRAARELAAWSYTGRQSFWTMARKHAVDPLVRRKVTTALPSDMHVPSWLGERRKFEQHFSKLYDFMFAAPRGRMFEYYTAREMENIGPWVMRNGFEDGIEVRYPFLSRPLVEFSLQLPIHLRVRPFARKYILRQAMRGILPEEIRLRSTKAGIDARIIWALQQEKAQLNRLLDQPILSELGLIEASKLRAAVEEARCGEKHNMVMLMAALSLETWLSVREGRLATVRKAA